MFRISQYMRELAQAQATGAYPAPARTRGNGQAPGPVVIWNLIRRCNLTCKHCYALSADHDYEGELSTQEVFGVMDDLKAYSVPVLILSGGEPLMRPDIFEIAGRAKAMKFYTGLSTNGTLIDEPMADRIQAMGFDYVGISLDGLRETHDHFRRLEGAFDRSLAAVRGGWTDETHAALIDRLALGGAKTIVYTAPLAQTAAPGAQEALARSVALAGNVLWPAGFASTGAPVPLPPSFYRSVVPELAGLGPDAVPVQLAGLAAGAAGVGHLQWAADSDGVLRRVPLLLSHDKAGVPSLAMLAVLRALYLSSADVRWNAQAHSLLWGGLVGGGGCFGSLAPGVWCFGAALGSSRCVVAEGARFSAA